MSITSFAHLFIVSAKYKWEATHQNYQIEKWQKKRCNFALLFAFIELSVSDYHDSCAVCVLCIFRFLLITLSTNETEFFLFFPFTIYIYMKWLFNISKTMKKIVECFLPQRNMKLFFDWLRLTFLIYLHRPKKKWRILIHKREKFLWHENGDMHISFYLTRWKSFHFHLLFDPRMRFSTRFGPIFISWKKRRMGIIF